MAGSPLATVADREGRRVLVAVDGAAAAAGLVPGMALADARAMRPDLATADADPAGEAAALAALADLAGRHTPWVAVEGIDETGGGGLLLDITGCAHLFGGEAGLLSDLVARVERAGFAARAAAADTPGAAWAVARFAGGGGRPWTIVPPGGGEAALAPLPVAALRLPPETVAGLAQLGLRRIADLLPLPRAPLTRRFGPAVARRLDQALGRLDEPISPRRPAPSRRVRLGLPEPIRRREDAAAGLDRLLAALAAGLEREELGARRLELALHRTDGAVDRLLVATGAPSRDPVHLARLFAERLDRLPPRPEGVGIDLLILSALETGPLAPRQMRALPAGGPTDGPGGDAGEDPALARLIDRLANRLGAANVRRFRFRESHRPERAVETVSALAPSPPPLPAAAASAFSAPPGGDRPRPVRLLPRPRPIEAVAPVPDGPPVLIRRAGATLRLARAEGPERIAVEWWLPRRERAADLRDYYRVEDAAGRRYWIYREGRYDAADGRGGASPPRWYLHGLFG